MQAAKGGFMTKLQTGDDASAAPDHAIMDIQVEGGGRRTVKLEKDRMLIGRTADAGIRLDNDTVSRHHAELLRDPFGRWWIRDLGSRNGMRVNGARCDQRLLDGSETIRLGNFTLRFSVGSGAPATADSQIDDGRTLVPCETDLLKFSTTDHLAAPPVSAAHLSRLLEFASALSIQRDTAERLRLLGHLLIAPPFDGTAAMVLRVDCTDPETPPRYILPPLQRFPATAAVRISRTLLNYVIRTRQPTLGTRHPGSDNQIEMTVGGDDAPTSAVACPLAGYGQQLDLLYVFFPANYASDEWLALATTAARQYQQAQDAWSARLRTEHYDAVERDLLLAQKTQASIVPRDLLSDSLQVAVSFLPCQWVAGDYADIVPLANGATYVGVADVCGKGMPAALISSALHTLVRTALRGGVSLVDMMALANQYLAEMLSVGRFITMAAVIIDPKAKCIECVRAGHPPPVLLRKDRLPVELDGGGNGMLAVHTGRFLSQTVEFDAAATLVMYTDGWPEMICNPAGEELGSPRVLEVLGRHISSRGSLREQLDAAVASLDAECKPRPLPGDDRTLVLVRRLTGQTAEQ